MKETVYNLNGTYKVEGVYHIDDCYIVTINVQNLYVTVQNAHCKAEKYAFNGEDAKEAIQDIFDTWQEEGYSIEHACASWINVCI